MKHARAIIVALATLCCLAPAPFGGSVAVTWGTAAPFTTGMSDIGTAGGLSQVSGGNLVGSALNPPQAWIFLNGYPGPATSLSVTWNSSSSIYLTLSGPGPYAVGVYPVQILDPDGQTLVDLGNLHITAETTPATEFGANLVFDYDFSQSNCSGACTTGSSIVTTPDQTANGNTLTPPGNAPTIQLNDTHFSQPNVTTAVFVSSSSQSLERASLAIGASPAALYIFGVVYMTSGAANQGIWDWSIVPFTFYVNNPTPVYTMQGIGTPTGAPTPGSSCVIAMTGWNGTTANFTLNNALVKTAADANGPQTNEPFYVGYRVASASYGNFVTPRIFGVNIVPTATNMLHMAQYLNNKYGCTADPGFLYATPMKASTASAPLRVQNTNGLANYYTGTTANLVCGGTSYACTNAGIVGVSGVNSMDLSCASTPAGTCDLDIVNIDGNSHSYSNAVTVTSSTNAWTNFGFTTLIWLGADNVTCSAPTCLSGSSGITSYFDKAAMGQIPVQSTFANEPTWYSGVGDSTMNGHPYGLPNGTSTNMLFVTGVANDGASTDFVASLIVNEPVSGLSTTTVFEPANASNLLRCQLNSKFPAVLGGSTTATFGSPVAGIQNIECDVPGGTNPTIYVNAANSGFAVTMATTGAANSFTGAQHMFVHSANGSTPSNAPLGEAVFLNTVPSSGQRTARETEAQSYWGAQ